jgi:hypothetical protein
MKLEKPDSNPPPQRPLTLSDFDHGGDTAANLVPILPKITNICNDIYL